VEVDMVTRIALVAAALGAWFGSQSLIGKRRVEAGGIRDGLHALTAPLNRHLRAHPRRADALLIASSALIDALAIFLIASAIFGPTLRPFLGLVLLFGLRQACQGLCALPAPEGMIWRRPAIPSLLVTYGVANDLFFSGHTAIAVYGAIELSRLGGPALAAAAIAIAAFEAATVLVLRAHYTMDVFAGAAAAVAVAALLR
jgi:hypothetical protein